MSLFLGLEDKIRIGKSAACSDINSIAVGTGATCTGANSIALGLNASAAANQAVVGSSTTTTYKFNEINEYITPVYDLDYNSVGPVVPGIKVLFSATATPWTAEIRITTWDSTTLTNIASTTFYASGGHGTGGTGANISIGTIHQTGPVNAWFDTITSDSATQISIQKSTNYASSPLVYKIKFYCKIISGVVLSLKKYSNNADLITF